ncbi:hypothetical protein [Paenibacillus amylolyticus]|uniref:hypothetical protein n=1 Tax=Paenibacillus amylolyticus TaxID=1451 RepID=UPI001290354D|nr:hypothetical protein [Paenibacillus amylolyticus]
MKITKFSLERGVAVRKIILFLIVIVLVCSACTMFNAFEGYMRKAKDSMKEGKYEETLEYIQNALIEEPNSKDAAALKTMATEALLRENNKAETKRFNEVIEPIYERLVAITEGINEDASNLSVSEAKSLLPELEQIKKELSGMSKEWSQSDVYSNTFQYLNGASEDLKLCLTAIIEDVSEPIELNGDHSRSNIVTQTFKSNDSKIRARLSFYDYTSKMESFYAGIPTK